MSDCPAEMEIIREMGTAASMCNTHFKKEKIAKSYAQRQKEYRERQKIKKLLQREKIPKKTPKTNAQRQHQFRQNQKKILQQNETLNLARKKYQAECAKRYRDKLKLKKQRAELDSLLSSKEDSLPTVFIENKKETDQHHDTNCEELIFTQFQIQPSMNNKAQQVGEGGECDESISHLMEPHVEIDENVIEPHVELEEGTDHQEGNVYPFDTLAVEFYEGADDATNAEHASYAGEAVDFHDDGALLNGMSHDSADVGGENDVAMNSDEMTADSTSENIEEEDNTNYNDIQRAYLEDLFSSSASASVDESSNPSFERIPLSRFPSIVKVVERAEYETIQILYQLLYQRSAWDTQEMLSKSILEFSGFTFNKSSEEYYNRDMMLQTLPNSVLVKIGAILCLDQVKNVLSNVGLGRHDLINAIMEFLAQPRKKTRGPRINHSANNKTASQHSEPCGCRNNCLSKFNDKEREFLAYHHTTITVKRKADAYFLNLIQVNRSGKKGGDDSKKHRDFKYTYRVKLGKKEVSVCKGGFMMLFNVKMSKLNKLQLRLKQNTFPKSLLAAAEYPAPEGTQEEVEPETPKDAEKKESESNESSISNSLTNSAENLSESSSSKPDNASSSNEETSKSDESVKKAISKKVPAVLVEKIDPNKLIQKASSADNKSAGEKKDTGAEISEKTEEEYVKKKLKEFPLVVKSLEDASEELLIDLHFLLFLKSADSNKLKENILEFDGFSFSSDSEEYDEITEFLQRMSGKLLTDVARSFSLGVMSKREETVQNILSFLMKPQESYLRTTASVPVILSDVELDDIEGFSDSDESITCEVVEKKVECIDLLSSGEDSDKEGGKISKKEKKSTASKVKAEPEAVVTASAVTSTITITPTVTTSVAAPKTPVPVSKPSGGVRKLRDFETIRKIVNTHPPEYLVDIYELLYLRKHEPSTLRDEILDFTGFTFEKGSQDYVKRKQVLDRMLYNNVRRVYNTLIHNSTEVKVFSKPTMINEIFQFLFKLPDTDTSVRPLPPGAKTLMPKQATAIPVAKIKPAPVVTAPPAASPASILPSPTGKLSDLKRVFQRVACFPCEYLVDVHKLLFMTDCDPKVIRQNIFGFKGFSFSADSSEFQQRKMYLEYLTFHSLRKISSVLTTRSVDLRNSTKHELASHLTDVLAEYCSMLPADAAAAKGSAPMPASAPTSTTQKNVTPIVASVQSNAPSTTASSNKKASPKKISPSTLKISIVDTRSISSPAVTTSGSTRGRKRKSQTVRQIVSEKRTATAQPADTSQFADIHLPEVEQYRQLYGANLSVYPSMQTITGITSFGTPQTFPGVVPQAMAFPIISTYPQPLHPGLQQPQQIIGLQSSALTMTTPIITQVSTKAPELIVPADIEQATPDTNKQADGGQKTEASKESPEKDSQNKDSEEDGDQPLSDLIGHPTDDVLKQQISEIVEKTDLQDITMNKVIKKIYDAYPKFDLSYRKDFIKSALRTILYKLGNNSDKTKGSRESDSPDCSVTTTDLNDSSLSKSPVTAE